MAKIGLAAELAKQAAQAAREEMVAASSGPTKKVVATGWTVPLLPHDFMLDAAMQRATMQVTGHYRQVLAPQGLQVELEEADTGGPTLNGSQHVAPERHPEVSFHANLREQGTGRLVKAYTAPALLTLFATQQQATGVVVDGQV